MKSFLECLLLRALALQAQGNIEPALATIEQALARAEPEGYIRIFVDEGQPMIELLQRAISQGIALPYINKLLTAFRFTSDDLSVDSDEQLAIVTPKSTPAPARTVQKLVEPLSDRELEVLRLLETDLSGPEIAAELVVSVNTVKTHIKRIYGKLNVRSRYEAVERAKKLNLL